MHVLLVDDDYEAVRKLRRALNVERVTVVDSIGRAKPLVASVDVVAARWSCDASRVNGLDLVRAMRRAGNEIPILLYDEEKQAPSDLARALSFGAVDYVRGPTTRVPEVAARLRALYRRTNRIERNITIGHITIDFVARRVVVDDIDIRATAGEFRLLAYLARRRRVTVPKDELYTAVFEAQHRGRESNALPVAVSRLRQKLGAASAQLIAVAGVGYRLAGR